jgi:3-hydroxyacyl-CoA dehydrogenase/enoyl-CoA hydratase/3-hydroxybutyryl-CoA epimerase
MTTTQELKLTDARLNPATEHLAPETPPAPRLAGSATTARQSVSSEDGGRNLRREVTAGNVCVLTFDRPDSSANVFDRDTLLELNGHLDFIEHQPQLRGVVLTSAKPAIFVAGADLHALARLGEAKDEGASALVELIDLGQRTFTRLASLPVPTIAAIHGACMGGGYELCLAADYRIASADRVTKIGLPETQLGLVPAWGGCTRLPRLVGLPKALDIILAGKTLAAKPALKAGLVDELVPREKLLELACERIARLGKGLRPRGRGWKLAVLNSRLMSLGLELWLHPRLLRKTRGHYPAVLKVLEVVTSGIACPVAQSLRLERDAIVKLAQGGECANLIRLFLQQERVKKLSVGPAEVGQDSVGVQAPPPVRRCAVIGAGVMGAGITQWLSARKLPVVLRDVDAGRVAKGLTSIRQLYREGVKRHLFTSLEARDGLDRVFPADIETPLHGVDLVIEAAVEKMELKKEIFRRLGAQTESRVILATNTSALSVTEIAAVTKSPERVVGLHFFNPVHRMQLVEVVSGPQTDPAVLARVVRFVQQIGKLPVVVNDRPGFVVNRILIPYLIEAGHLFEAGARIEDIDEAMLDFGMPMGPLRLIDEVGVDVAHHVAHSLAGAFSERLRVPAVLEKMLETKLLGRKGGRGFYDYGKKTPTPTLELAKFLRDNSARTLSRDALRRRMVLLMVNEAARCLEELVVASPDDVDFAMVMGAGFAPFRGGPLRYADSLGLSKVVEEMNRLVDSGVPYFAPCDLLQVKAVNGETFHAQKGGAS